MKEKAFETKVDKEWNKDGFQMTFANGCTISVVFGKYTYSDNGETTAEVAAWNGNGDWMTWNDGHWTVYPNGETDVMSRQTTDDVAMLISELVKLK